MNRNLKIISIVIASIALISLVGWYLYHQTEQLFRGPEITILEPVDGSTVNEPITSIRGSTKNLQSLTLNGLTITTDEDGVFSEVRALLPGLNIWKIIGADRFGRSREVRFEIFHSASTTTE